MNPLVPRLATRLSDIAVHVGRPHLDDDVDLADLARRNPTEIQRVLAPHLGNDLVVCGSTDRRLVVVPRESTSGWTIADLSGRPHSTRDWPEWTRHEIAIENADSWLSGATLSSDAIYRLLRPRILLVALYHPEYFPLPRFSLAISDLARAARNTLMGQVQLIDMQLGAGVSEIINKIQTWRPDIVGVSATFGQHDLLSELLDEMQHLDPAPEVVTGGSLTARNERLLIDRYPNLLIARAAGESTISDLISRWHGDLALEEVRGVGYAGAARGAGTLMPRYRRTASLSNRTQADIFPELDLLPATIERNGVAQIETSRGCTNYCSFCPRGHKGTWAGTGPESLRPTLSAMAAVFDRHPEVPKTLYVVDEEFVGRDEGAVDRAIDVAAELYSAGFRWESSCRIDQVVRTNESTDWHSERVAMWRRLCELGLRRMLFGVESGVTSILDRFNKETTSEQNALAIRTLSALGVPTRYTYITFDHLMTQDELTQTLEFQARTDLLLEPLPHLRAEEIVRGVRDPDFVASHSIGRPFYTEISYMLVSMECLLGSAYARRVAERGLAGAARPSLGRLDAEFADWRIGRCSFHAQLWIDRNFALDYTLKSLEKILDGEPRLAVRAGRQTIKDGSFNLLRAMAALVETIPIDEDRSTFLDRHLADLLEDELSSLHRQVDAMISRTIPTLPENAATILEREWKRWRTGTEWRLINAADPCGT